MSLRNYLELNADFKKKHLLKVNSFTYSCIDDFVVRNGKDFISEPLTKEEWVYVREVFRRSNRRYQKRKQCYLNAQMHAIDFDFEKRMKYTEGYVLAFIPILHGWLDFNGKVVDVTLRHPGEPMKRKGQRGYQDRAIGNWNSPVEYLGVRFKTEFVLKQLVESGHGSSLIDDWKGGWPALKGQLEDQIIK